MSRHRIYTSVIRLYPKDFRDHYGDDLTQHFADLVNDRGTRAALTRTGLDLLVTIPRYRLETIMNEHRSATTLSIAVALLAAGGILAVLIGFYPGVAMLLAALVLAVAQRSTLARAIRTPDSSRRRRRLTVAAVLAMVCLVSLVSFANAIKDEHISSASLLVHNAIGVPSMIGAIVYLLAGLLTPRTPGRASEQLVA